MHTNLFIYFQRIIEYYRNLALFQINNNHLTVPTKYYLPNLYYSVDENCRHSTIDLSDDLLKLLIYIYYIYYFKVRRYDL